MDSKKRESHKPPLEMRDSGVSCYTPSPPPPKKSSLPKPSEGSARSMHKELCHQHPSMESFDQNVSSNNPEEFHGEMMIPPRLDLSSIIGDDSESDVSSSGIVSTDRTSQSHDEHYPELALDTPSTDSRMSPAGRILQGYQSDSTSPSSSSSPSSSGHHNLRRCGSGGLEDESEGSVLKVKLKLKSARPHSGSGVRKREFTVTKVRNSPPLSSSSDLLHVGKEQAYKHTPDDVIRSKYVPLPSIGVQGADQNVNVSKEHRESEQKQSVIDKPSRSPTLEITPSEKKDIREQRLKALERSASQGEISRKFPTPPPQSAKTVSRRAMRMQQFARRKSASQAESASRQSVRPRSQASDSSKSVLLAIRLPDGSRVQNLFGGTQSLQSVVQFALKQGKCSLDKSSVCLVTNDMPKRELMDLSKTIEDAELCDRTLLNLEELE